MPFTSNAGFNVPNTGDLVGTWGSAAINPDFVAVDGMLSGVQSVALSNVPVTLTMPGGGFAPTPGAGPTQSQNRVLRFTGALTADVTVTLPIPASYIVENYTTGAFDVILRGATAATEVIAIPQGESVEVYNDGSRVRFMGLGRMGAMEHWAGLTAMPAWVGKCTVRPYLVCDDPSVVYNVSDFPYLGARLLGKFGGNGVTTFAAPDMRGRVPLAYDGTGTRITVAGCGINGQALGASLDQQTVTLTTDQIPAHSHGVTDNGHTHGTNASTVSGSTHAGGNTVFSLGPASITTATTGISINNTGGGQAHNNVQPSIVTGIWVIKT